MEIYGSGYRYGLQAQGKKVFNAYENQIDQRACRQAVNLNHYRVLEDRSICISGQTYAPADTIVRKGDGIDKNLMNAYREKSVYLQLATKLTRLTEGVDSDYDASFVGDGLDHDSPIEKAAAIYGAIKRHNKCMYGNVESMIYIDTGMQISGARLAREADHIRAVGDTFIGPYAFRRTGYVSNKVGTFVDGDTGGHALTECPHGGRRDICRPIHKYGENLIDYAGFADYSKLPKTGETCDARNYANLHPGRRASESFGGQVTEPEADFFYPGTITTLVHFWVETDINICMRSRGEEEIREVYYPNLGILEYDSAAPQKTPWEDSWMNDFYIEQRRPSKWQVAVQAFIRSTLGILFPLGIAGFIGDTTTGLDLTTSLWILPIFAGLFTVLDKGPFSRQFIKNILGFDDCRTDEDGGTEDTWVMGFRDNYHGYNPDYQTLNMMNLSLSMPDPFNVCDCDDCLVDETTNEIIFSNKQQIVSSRDSYRNFKANNYLNIPAHSGRIRNMFILDNKFHVHTSDGIWLIQYQSGSVQLDNGRALILGGGDLLTQPEQVLEGVIAGYMGLDDPNSAIVTQLGYIFIDRESRKIIRYSSQGLVDMTINGMRSFYRERLPFCSTDADCTDERGDQSYILGMDYRHNRIMFTKRDGDSSFTASFDPIRNIWISLHSYIPRGYMWDRGQMFSFTDDTIYVHDQSPSHYQTFYGKHEPHVLQFIATGDMGTAKEYSSSYFETEASKSVGGLLNLRNRKITFNKAIFSNSSQTTELLTLEPRDASDNKASRKSKETYPIVGVHRRANEWRVNDLQDIILDANEPIWIQETCSPFEKFNSANAKRSSKVYKQNILFDKYLRNHLIFDNFSDVQLVTKFGITFINVPIQ